MLSSEDDVGAGGYGLGDLVEGVALDLDDHARPARPGPGRPPRRCRAAAEVVVLDEDGVGQAAPVVGAPAGPDRRLLQGPEARAVSCGCRRIAARLRRRRRRRRRRVRVATPDRWPRKLSAVRSPVSTDRSGPVDLAERTCPAPSVSPSAAAQVTVTDGSSWAKTSVATAVPARTPATPGHEAPAAGGVGRDERHRRDVAERRRGPRPAPGPRRPRTADGGRRSRRADMLHARARRRRPAPAGAGRRRVDEPLERLCGVRVVERGGGAPRDSRRSVAAVTTAAATVGEAAQLPGGGLVGQPGGDAVVGHGRPPPGGAAPARRRPRMTPA